MLGLDHVVTVPSPGYQPRYSYGDGQGGKRGAQTGAGGGATAAGRDEAGAGIESGSRAAMATSSCEIDLDAAREDPNEIHLD